MKHKKNNITIFDENNKEYYKAWRKKVKKSKDAAKIKIAPPVVETSAKPKDKNISYTQELLRKSIHLCSLSIPTLYIFVSKETALLFLIPMAILALIIDLSTKKYALLNEFYMKYMGKMLRKHEMKKKKLILNGASWVLISAVLTVLVFPKIIAVTGFTILIISDICAALFGRKFGKTPLFNKSWEGTSAFIVSAIAVVFVHGFFFNAPPSYYICSSIGAIAAGFTEAASKVLKVDDNLSIPTSFGIITWLTGLIALNLGAPFLTIL